MQVDEDVLINEVAWGGGAIPNLTYFGSWAVVVDFNLYLPLLSPPPGFLKTGLLAFLDNVCDQKAKVLKDSIGVGSNSVNRLGF